MFHCTIAYARDGRVIYSTYVRTEESAQRWIVRASRTFLPDTYIVSYGP